MINIINASITDAKNIALLARSIWVQHYTPIIGEEQVEYMLNKFQNEIAIKAQIDAGIDYYLVNKNSQNIGYIALQQKQNNLFISKFYLSFEFRGQGIAHLMLNKINEIASLMKVEQLELTVNKYNPAYQAYLKLGFENSDSVVADIGGGYVMDDYVMVKKINKPTSP